MNPSQKILLLALLILFVSAGGMKYLEHSRKKSLKTQAGTSTVIGNAAHSLSTEKMRISKANREKGVIGELGVAKDLDYLANEYGLTALHDLSIPGSNANIDHLLVTRKVVYVIDAKNYKGIVNISKNKQGKKTLKVGGRDQTLVVEKVKKYAESIKEFLESEEVSVKVMPLLAFYQAKFHEDSSASVDGVTINVFGIENELLRNANIKSPEVDIDSVTNLILGKFPLKN